MTTAVRFEVGKASPRLGAEIAGVDLAAGVDDETAQALREAFWAYKVLVFRGQHLSPSQHVEAVRIFDEPFDHPTAVHRHGEDRLVPNVSSAPVFLAAASQRTRRIELGTAVLPIGYESPFRLAEDLSMADVLSRGRLQVGFSAGVRPIRKGSGRVGDYAGK